MKNLIKLILLAGIVVFALYDYRLLSFEKGFSRFDMIEDKNIVEFMQTVGSIKKVEYYKNIFPVDYKYCLYIETEKEVYLLNAEKEDIDALNVAGFLASNLKPQKINPLPIYIELVIGSFILCTFFFPNNKN